MEAPYQAQEFERLAARAGLGADSPEYQALFMCAVGGLEVADVAGQLRVPVEHAQALLRSALERLRASGKPVVAIQDEQKRFGVREYRELLQIMRGVRNCNPPSPVIGFDKHYPGDPAHAQVVATRAKILTAEDLAFGEGRWREASIVEKAQRGKQERRQKREKKERRG